MPDVLVVDDRAEIGRALTTLLKSMGITAYYTMDGHSALSSLSQEEFQLVILDRSMPGMDGVEVLRRIRAQPNLEDLPVIIFTSDRRHELTAEVLAEGANDFLCKTDIEKLMQTVKKYVKRRAMSPNH